MYPLHGWLARQFGGENGLNIISSFYVKDDFLWFSSISCQIVGSAF
jgi:hypothetical protein